MAPDRVGPGNSVGGSAAESARRVRPQAEAEEPRDSDVGSVATWTLRSALEYVLDENVSEEQVSCDGVS